MFFIDLFTGVGWFRESLRGLCVIAGVFDGKLFLCFFNKVFERFFWWIVGCNIDVDWLLEDNVIGLLGLLFSLLVVRGFNDWRVWWLVFLLIVLFFELVGVILWFYFFF